MTKGQGSRSIRVNFRVIFLEKFIIEFELLFLFLRLLDKMGFRGLYVTIDLLVCTGSYLIRS